jgi:hypothetical protein
MQELRVKQQSLLAPTCLVETYSVRNQLEYSAFGSLSIALGPQVLVAEKKLPDQKPLDRRHARN